MSSRRLGSSSTSPQGSAYLFPILTEQFVPWWVFPILGIVIFGFVVSFGSVRLDRDIMRGARDRLAHLRPPAREVCTNWNMADAAMVGGSLAPQLFTTVSPKQRPWTSQLGRV